MFNEDYKKREERLMHINKVIAMREAEETRKREEILMATGMVKMPDGSIRVIKTNRNDPCPCGSGKKYKKCCGKEER